MLVDKEALLDQLTPLIAAIESFKCGNFLQPTSALFDTVLGNCILLLEKNSFAVTRCESYTNNVKDLPSLINYYYNFLHFRRRDIQPNREVGADLATANALLTSIETNYSFNREQALAFVSKLIVTLFDNLDVLNIDSHILAMFRGVFGQNKMAWITENIISCLNNDELKLEKMAAQADTDTEIYIKLKNVQFGWFNEEES